MERESFVFYSSWLNGIDDFTDEEQGAIALALLRYCAFGKEPEKVPAIVKMAFTYAKPQIDANNAKYSVGHKGGSQNGCSNNPYGRKGKPEGKELTKNYQRTNKKLTRNYQETNKKLTKNYQETNMELPNVNEADNSLGLFAEIEDTPREKTRYELYREWLTENAPYIANNFKNTLTEKEFNAFLEKYDAEQISEKILQIENRVDLRKKYVNLNLTLINWFKRDEHRTDK